MLGGHGRLPVNGMTVDAGNPDMGMTAVFPVIENPRVVFLVAVDAFLVCFGDAAVDDNRADMTQIPHRGLTGLLSEGGETQKTHGT